MRFQTDLKKQRERVVQFVDGVTINTLVGSEGRKLEESNNIVFTLEQLEKKLKFWKEELNLGIWDIIVYVLRRRDFINDDCIAEITFKVPTHCAVIRILDPIDITPNDFGTDMEKSLVHELLHLKFSVFDYLFKDNDNIYEHLYERNLDDVANTLVDLKREGEKKEKEAKKEKGSKKNAVPKRRVKK
jgi:hypothetical protein